MSASAEAKVASLRRRTKTQLLEQLRENKRELAALRVAQVTGGAPNKLAKIKTVRLNIARILTVMRQTQLQQLRQYYKNRKHQPQDLRPKKTRAIRRQLTHKEANAKTLRQRKKEANFPRRKFALKAAA